MTHPSQNNTMVAVIVLVGTVFALSFGDALVRKMGLDPDTRMSLWQVFLVRSGLALLVLVPLAFAFGQARGLIPTRWILLRSAMLVLMWFLYYVGLRYLPLSVGAATYYTLPLFLLMFSTVLTGDRIGKLGAVGIALGFIGVLIITDPQASGVTPLLILPLGAAMLYALSMILTRTRCINDSVIALAVWLNAAFLIIGAVGVVAFQGGHPLSIWSSNWVAMDGGAWGNMVVSALAILIGSVGTAFAYQRAPAPLLGAFDFSYLAFAVLWGWLLFDEKITMQVALGMSLILGAGVLALTSGKSAAGPNQSRKA